MKRKLVPNMLTKDIPAVIARELKVRPKQVEAAIGLLDDGNTVPFIARYRKEATGSLEDEQLRSLEERLTYLRNIVKRQEDIIGKIEEQGKLTSELRSAIEKAVNCRIWMTCTSPTSRKSAPAPKLPASTGSNLWPRQ